MSLADKSFSVLQRDLVLFIANILTSVFLARSLGPQALGLWVILNLIPSYAEAFGRIKVDVAAVYYLGSGRYQISEVVLILNCVALVASFVIILPIITWIDWFSFTLFKDSSVKVTDYIYIMLMQIPVGFLYMNYMYLHISREDVKSINLMVLTRALFSSGLIIVLVFLLDDKILGVVIGSTVGGLGALVIGVVKFGWHKHISTRFNLELLCKLVKYGFKLHLGTIVSHFNSYSSQAIVVAYCLTPQVAFFSLAQQLGQMINKVTDAMGVFLFPRISKETTNFESAKLASKSFRVAIVMLLPISIVIAIVMKPMILLLYGEEYLPVLIPFYIIFPALVVTAASSTLLMYFQGIGRADVIAKLTIVPLITQVLLGISLVPLFGIVGAASTFAVALFVTACLQIIVFLRLANTTMVDSLVIRREDVNIVREFVLNKLKFKKLLR
jgi:O-antigen/teichoic acid export membrane protein